MKKFFIASFLILSAVLMFQGCSDSSDDPIINVIHITDDVTTATTWSSDYLYVIDNSIYVNATLTIEPGTIIKVSPDSSVTVNNTGSINASGSSDAHIVFTSLKDDSKGGDTNEDGSSTSPTGGDWGTLVVDSNNCTFTYCDFFYGGQGNYDDYAQLQINTGTQPLSHLTFARSKNAGLLLNTPGITVTDCTFYLNDKPLIMEAENTVDDSNLFHNPANINQKNTRNGIWITQNVEGNATWGATEVPFVLTDSMFVYSGTLTLSPGVIVKLHESYININANGAIQAAGTAVKPITFTSLYDDEFGGDTPNSITLATPGDWSYISIEGNGSTFAYCDFYYGGAGNYPDYAMITFGTASATIDSCIFAHSANAALNIVNATNATVVTNNAFFDNTCPLWMSGDFSISDTNIFHNPANILEGNAQNGIWLDGSWVSTPRTWSVTEVPYICPSMGIEDDITLTIASGAILKFEDDAYFQINEGAALAGFANVTFTSLKDDTRGGDSNGDGNATSPAWGNWDGVYNNNNDPSEVVGAANIFFDSNSTPAK